MIIALNNKSNLGKEAFLDYQTKMANIKADSKLIMCPTFLNIPLFNLNNMSLGSENVSRTDPGAFTGEISAKDLKTYGVEYSIIGHSERREYQKESLEDIHEKLLKLLENDITPILCIGETKQEREDGKVEEVLGRELTTAVEGLSQEDKNKIIIAYEPIWSIGTGIIPTMDQVAEVFDFIKEQFPTNNVLYGGSANEKNIDLLKTVPQIDGYLLGGLSLKPEELQNK